jgi:hypothetical protein
MFRYPGARMRIAVLVGVAYPLTFTASNIISGLRCTGISPLNTLVFFDADYIQGLASDQPALHNRSGDNAFIAALPACVDVMSTDDAPTFSPKP